MSARNTCSALPNTKTGLSLSRLSLASYFIPFVTGTGTELQRRLQWAHQSMPTDCGPTDTLEVGINFFVENVEKAATMCWNNSMCCTLVCASFLLFSCGGGLSSFVSDSFRMSKVARVRMTPCFRQMFVWGGFRPFPVFLLLFFFPSLWLLWQALLAFSPHGSGLKSMPICVFSCSSLCWWRLETIETDEKT